MNVEKGILSYIEDIAYESLPNSSIDMAKRAVLDIIATSIAGSSAEGIDLLAGMAQEWGGKQEATIAVYGHKVPAPIGALVNASMARARDLDGVHERAGLHVNAAIIPAAFVLAEYGKIALATKVSGKDFILATVIGSDWIARFRLAGGRRAQTGWSGDIFAPLAIALMGSKLLGFKQETMMNALGIAYAQAAGNMQAHVEGSLMVRVQQGFGCKAGVLAVLLAGKGFTGAHDVLEGKYGFYPLYMGGEFIPEELTGGLGERFEDLNVSFKPYPCCKMTHGAIYGISELRKKHKIQSVDVERIDISTNSTGYDLCGLGERKIIPRNVSDAQFSYYYTAAVALLRGTLSLNDFTEQAITHPETLALAKKVKVKIDPAKDRLKEMIPPIDIEIQTRDGCCLRETVSRVKGHPENPMTLAEIKNKLHDCIHFSAKTLNLKNVDRMCLKIEDLENLEDINEIFDTLY